METSIFLARIFAVVYLTAGVGMLLNQEYFKKGMKKMLDDFTAVLLGGLMSLILGMLILNVHSGWAQDWTSLVTLIGYIALLKGVLLFLAPEWMLRMSKKMVTKLLPVSMSLAILFGLAFGYFGYLA